MIFIEETGIGFGYKVRNRWFIRFFGIEKCFFFTVFKIRKRFLLGN